jgi:hypothetical protein
MSLLTVDEFEDLIGTGADPSIIQDAIDREEAEMAHLLGGPLVGERTETYRPTLDPYGGPVYLLRFTDSVTVTDSGATIGVRLLANGSAIERDWGAWVGDVVVTYTPNDELRVRRALIELVREVLVPERDRAAATDRPPINEQRRMKMVRSLRPRLGHSTLRVRLSDRITPEIMT